MNRKELARILRLVAEDVYGDSAREVREAADLLESDAGAVEREREACAAVCETMADVLLEDAFGARTPSWLDHEKAKLLKIAARTIRGRG